MSNIHSMSNTQLFLYLVIRLAAQELNVKVACGVNHNGSKVHVAMDKNKRCKTAIWNMSHLANKLDTKAAEAFAVAFIATKIKLMQLLREFDDDLSD